MPLATYESDRFTITDHGDIIILERKRTPAAAIAFGDWDVIMEAARVMVRGLSPDMRRQFLRDAFSARELEEAFDERNAEAL